MTKKHKSCWNYRVVAELGPTGVYFYSIRDVYYKNEKPHAWGVDPQYSVGETTKDVFNALSYMSKAISKPLLVIVDDKLVEHHNKSALNAKAEDIKKHGNSK